MRSKADTCSLRILSILWPRSTSLDGRSLFARQTRRAASPRRDQFGDSCNNFLPTPRTALENRSAASRFSSSVR